MTQPIRTRTTVEEAQAGIMPTEPGLYAIVGTPNDPERLNSPETIATQRIFRLWNRQWTEVAVNSHSERDAVVSLVQQYGWALGRLGIE